MYKKLFFSLVVVGILSSPALAIEPPQGATIPWGPNNNAYTSNAFNAVLEAYGLKLGAEAAAQTPATYASSAGGEVKFNNRAIAYKPAVYHKILTAYGLELNTAEANAILGSVPYATIRDGKPSFRSGSIAYRANELATILKAYSLVAQEAAPMMAKPKPMVGDSDGDGINDDRDKCPGTPKGIMVDDRGCWSHPSNLLFDFDKAVVRDEYKAKLGEAKKVFDAYPNMTVKIVGHTCDMGPEAYNQGLSERRAEAVRDFLVNEAGVDSSRLTVSGQGESNPAFPNDSESNRQKNRRVEFMPSL